MRRWQQLYLVRLFRTNMWIGITVTLFFIGNVVANVVMPTEITPIYNWNMYAFPLPDQDTFDLIEVTYNGDKVLNFKHTWNEPQKVLLGSTLQLFVASHIDGKIDYSDQHFQNQWLPSHPGFKNAFPSFYNFPSQKEFKAFSSWYKRYLEKHTCEQIDSIRLVRKTVKFTDKGSVQEISSRLIYTIP